MGFFNKIACYFGFHKRDENCYCKNCGQIVHKLRTIQKWEGTGIFETSQEPWLEEADEFVKDKCTFCDYESEERETGRREWILQ